MTRVAAFSYRARCKRLVAAVSLSAILMGSAASKAQACAFDMIKPERTAIDWIVETDTLVLARPGEENPFAFEVTELLRGTVGAEKIGHLVNSTDRKRLAANSGDAVLFAFDGTGWTRVTYVNAAFRATMATALENSDTWFGAMPKSRIDFIETLQKSSDPRHKSLVIGELDKVPYAQLRDFDLQISDDALLDLLWSREGYAYQAILAVLLGFTDTELARAEINDFIDRAADVNWKNNLGAFSAALIELDGLSGVNKLVDSILRDPLQPLDKVEQVVMALSVHHALAGPDVQVAIDEALRDLIRARPQAAVPVARQFTLQSDWSQASLLTPLVQQRAFASMQDLLTVSVYIAKARENASLPEETTNEG